MRLRWKQVTDVYDSWDDRYGEWNTHRSERSPILQYINPNNPLTEEWIDIPTVKFERKDKWINDNLMKEETEIV